MYYCGIDLGARKSQVCIIDETERTIVNRKVDSDIASVLGVLDGHDPNSLAVVAESTFNWQWLVDGLRASGYDIRLAHTLGMRAISYAKVKTDRRDARTLARLLRVGMIPEAYACPKDVRDTRDLLRTRWNLVANRAREYRALRLLLYSQGRWDHDLKTIKSLTCEEAAWLSASPDLQFVGRHGLQRIDLLSQQIDELEQRLVDRMADRHAAAYRGLKTLPGIGVTLAQTIILETGSIDRFPDSRRYSSYCRVVPGCANSCDVQRRGRNSKQGNRYLKWAFMHGSLKAVQFDSHFKELHRRYASRHQGTGGKIKAYNTIAHRLAQVAYRILRDESTYQPELLFRKEVA